MKLGKDGAQTWSFDVAIRGVPEDHLVLRAYRDDEGQWDAIGELYAGRRESTDPRLVVLDPASPDGAVVAPPAPSCLQIEPYPQLDIPITDPYAPGTGEVLIRSTCATESLISITLVAPETWNIYGDGLVPAGDTVRWTVQPGTCRARRPRDGAGPGGGGGSGSAQRR